MVDDFESVHVDENVEEGAMHSSLTGSIERESTTFR